MQHIRTPVYPCKMRHRQPRPLVSRQTAPHLALAAALFAVARVGARALGLALKRAGQRGLSFARTMLVLSLCAMLPTQALAMRCQHLGAGSSPASGQVAGLITVTTVGAASVEHHDHCADHGSQPTPLAQATDDAGVAASTDSSPHHPSGCDRPCAACCIGAWLPAITLSVGLEELTLPAADTLDAAVSSPMPERLERPPKHRA